MRKGCDTCKIHKEMPALACCAWYIDNVLLGNKTPEECPKYTPCIQPTEKGGESDA